MPTNHYESTNQNFDCDLMGSIVEIRKVHLIRQDNSGEVVAKIIQETDCSHKDSCGIGSSTASGRSYDWTKCSYMKAGAN